MYSSVFLCIVGAEVSDVSVSSVHTSDISELGDLSVYSSVF